MSLTRGRHREYKDKDSQTDLQDVQAELFQHGRVLQVGPNNNNVNITLHKDFLAAAKQGGILKLETFIAVETEGRRILTLEWEDRKEAAEAIKSSVKLTFNQLMEEIYGKFIWILNTPDKLEPFEKLIISIKEKYNARLAEIFSGSLIFIFMHEDRESASKMVRDETGVEEIFRTFVAKCLNTSGELQIEVFQDDESVGRDRYGGQPLHDQAEKLYIELPGSTSEKDSDDLKFRLPTYKEDRDRYAGQPLYDQGETLQTKVPRLTGEKDSDDGKFSLSTYEKESKSEEDWTESSKEKLTPRSDGSMDTLLCIDVSGSIGEEGLKKVKGIAKEIVDGIQKVAKKYDLEENIGVIAMGSDVRIVQRPTNDYSQVFDAIADLSSGGRSPIYTALCECVAVMDGRKSEVHRIPPRTIFITDGYATDDATDTGRDTNNADIKANSKIMKLIRQFGKNERVPRPIVWIPVGQPNRNFLGALAKIGKGELVEEEYISSLYNYHRMQQSIGHIYDCVKDDDSKGQDVEYIADVTRGLIDDITEAEQKLIIEAVRSKLEKKDEVDPDKSPNDFTHIHEVTSLPPVGTRVVRGEGWRYGDEDSGGPGTIINHSKDENHVLVMWDVSNTLGRYSYGADGRYDLNIIQEPRDLKKDELIEIGVKVNRGADWTQVDEDGGEGNCGVVVRKRADGMVKVRWSNGSITECKYGFEGKKELEICQSKKPVAQSSTTEKVTTKASSTQSSKPALEEVIEKPSLETPHVFWRWRDDLGQWRLYSKEVTVKLDENYLKGGRSCLVKKGNDSCRIVFQKPFHERGVQGGTRRDVERILVNDMRRDELISLEVAIDDRSSWIS